MPTNRTRRAGAMTSGTVAPTAAARSAREGRRGAEGLAGVTVRSELQGAVLADERAGAERLRVPAAAWAAPAPAAERTVDGVRGRPGLIPRGGALHRARELEREQVERVRPAHESMRVPGATADD